MSTYLCVNCDHKFSDQESLCIDWRDKKLRFACPKCETCLEVIDKPLLPRGSFRFYVVILFLTLLIIVCVTLFEGFSGLNISRLELFGLVFKLESQLPTLVVIYFSITHKPAKMIKTRLW